MLSLLCQTTPVPDDTHAKWYAGVVLIIAAGVAGIVLIMGVIFIFRMSRRWQASIERDIAARRAKPTPTTDLWRESAERYVDADLLSAQELAERRGEDEDDTDEDNDDDDDDDPDTGGRPFGTPPPPNFGTGFQDTTEDEDDPFGLFKDKPYVEPEEPFDPDEEDDDPDDDDETDEFDPDSDEDDIPF